MKPAPRDGWIDVLRAASAVAVVLFHLNVVDQAIPPGGAAQSWHLLWLHGHYGVPVFFALSGFCLLPGWARANGTAAFLRRRFARLFPPYWGSLVLVLALAAGFKLVTGVNDIASVPRDPVAIAATALLLTDPLTAVPRMNWVYWTLTPLLADSIALGALLAVPARARPAALAVFHLLACAADLWWRAPATGWLMLLRYWPMFGAGAALALRPSHRKAGDAMLAVSLLHGILSTTLGHDEPHYALAALLTVAVLWLTHGRATPRGLAPVAWLGRISYSLFLVHVPVGINALHRLLPAAPAGAAGLIGGQVLLLAACIAAAALFYRVCEHRRPTPVTSS